MAYWLLWADHQRSWQDCRATHPSGGGDGGIAEGSTLDQRLIIALFDADTSDDEYTYIEILANLVLPEQ
ncbi:hypothetical protein ACFOY2_36750 [Nonomuraea purpurea]|uniref:Uncharacterized protein n=1 Tax=Nonomuraea purpurea TaxID=1849276 RepID=A0ABV8GIW1_9ACTN